MLKDRESFAILLASKDTNILGVVQNIALRKHIKFNRVKLSDDDEYSYLLYTESTDKQYIFDMVRNKRLKLVWKDDEEFYIIDFSINTKGDIITYLSYEDADAGSIVGDVITYNLKPQFNAKKVMLVSSQQLEEIQPYNYEKFKFYVKN